MSTAPKQRNLPRQQYYTKGEAEAIKPSRFKSHIAEPSHAKTIIQRNFSSNEEPDIKPKAKFIRSSGYTPGLYSGRQESSVPDSSLSIYSLTEAKLQKSKTFSNQATRPSSLCAKTVTLDSFKSTNPDNSMSIPIEENWLYRTRTKPITKPPQKEAADISEDCPDWFKIKENPSVKMHDITKSQGFDGTVTILSRITGWITVSPRSRNRQLRLGRYGPFDKKNKDKNFQDVSDLAPAWMQTSAPKVQHSDYFNEVPHPCVRKEQKRMILAEKDQPKRSVFSFGDSHHNVNTAEEVKAHIEGLERNPVRLIEWNEDPKRQRYDKPITWKVGCN